jgi:hypothetical protein
MALRSWAQCQQNRDIWRYLGCLGQKGNQLFRRRPEPFSAEICHTIIVSSRSCRTNRDGAMASKVRLRLGNLFDGPTDLIVLPCSTGGSITGFVARSLVDYKIPHPRVGLRLGTAEFMPFEGAENIAQFVAFAASVAWNDSTTEAIRNIGSLIGAFTQEHPEVRAIAAPLLGAGAGGLHSEKVVAALREGFSGSASEAACLTISVLHQDVYERLRAGRRRLASKAACQPRVFISHTSRTKVEETGSFNWLSISSIRESRRAWTNSTCGEEWTYRSGCATNSP